MYIVRKSVYTIQFTVYTFFATKLLDKRSSRRALEVTIVCKLYVVQCILLENQYTLYNLQYTTF